jgi:hypothetical protein
VTFAEYLAQFNPFYYFYNTEHASKALDRQLELKKRSGERLLCPPPELPPLSRAFDGIPRILCAAPVQKAIICTLDR